MSASSSNHQGLSWYFVAHFSAAVPQEREGSISVAQEQENIWPYPCCLHLSSYFQPKNDVCKSFHPPSEKKQFSQNQQRFSKPSRFPGTQRLTQRLTHHQEAARGGISLSAFISGVWEPAAGRGGVRVGGRIEERLNIMTASTSLESDLETVILSYVLSGNWNCFNRQSMGALWIHWQLYSKSVSGWIIHVQRKRLISKVLEVMRVTPGTQGIVAKLVVTLGSVILFCLVLFAVTDLWVRYCRAFAPDFQKANFVPA